MKGIAKHSMEYVDPIGLRKWYGLELEFDQTSKHPLDALAEVESLVKQAVIKSGGQPIIDTGLPPSPPRELPVINKAQEKLEIAIENAATVADLIQYKDRLSTPYLTDVYFKRYNQLTTEFNERFEREQRLQGKLNNQ